MDTAEALKKAMQAVKDAGIPEDLWSTALPLALADLRDNAAAGEGRSSSAKASTGGGTKSAPKKSSSGGNDEATSPSVLTEFPDEAELFERVSAETDVSVEDLGDVFHVEDGELQLKVISKNLGDNKRAAMINVAALLGAVVFAGTSHTKVPFKDINTVCKAKHCYDSGNGASYIKATPGFAPVGSRASQALTSKSGWQAEFSKAVDRVLGRTDSPSR